MDCIEAILRCLGEENKRPSTPSFNEKAITAQPTPYSDDPVQQFLEILRTAENADEDLEKRLKSIVSANGLKENIAKSILNGIKKMLAEGAKKAKALAEASEKATTTAYEFAEKHPGYAALIAAGTLVALGILVMLAPWVLDALGFGRVGPRAGSFAARWMSEIALSEGHVSKGSFYAYLQRLGMKW